VRTARDYATQLDAPHANQLARLERTMDRESYLLADKRWWPETLPALFYQQFFNQAVEIGKPFPGQKSPACWIHQARSVGATDQALLRILAGHTGSVYSVGFSPDGRLALTSDSNGWTFFWHIQQVDKLQRLGLSVTSDRVSSLFWQDTTHLLLADYGGGSGRTFVYHMQLEGECWESVYEQGNLSLQIPKKFLPGYNLPALQVLRASRGQGAPFLFSMLSWRTENGANDTLSRRYSRSQEKPPR
jgi:WD40 repeat protein